MKERVGLSVCERMAAASGGGTEASALILTTTGVITAKLLELSPAGTSDGDIAERAVSLTEALLVGLGMIERSPDGLLRRLSLEEFSAYNAAAHRALKSMFDKGVIYRVEHIDVIRVADGPQYEAACSDSDGESSVRHWNPVDGSWRY